MSVYRLEGGVQHYAWGDTRFIPELLGTDNPDGTPYAELWMGAHPDMPSAVVIEGERRPLSDVLEGDLPFLLKILSAASPLSIQAHPSETQAREGYERENAGGVPRDAPTRNYRDPFPKPELLCALTDFYALRGFRPDGVPELGTSRPLRELYGDLMTMPQEDVDAMLAPMLARLDGRYAKSDREYWLLRCHETYSREGHYDRGLFSVLLLNLVKLSPGEAIYLDAGTLHAYLEGSGVELMASSNNVLRGGLTPKHVDIPELMHVVSFEPENAIVLHPTAMGECESRYVTPTRYFELRRIECDHVNAADHEAEILIVTDGAFTIDALPLERGQIVYVPAGEPYTITGRGTLYKATQPT